jgi:hypothetical protein
MVNISEINVNSETRTLEILSDTTNGLVYKIYVMFSEMQKYSNDFLPEGYAIYSPERIQHYVNNLTIIRENISHAKMQIPDQTLELIDYMLTYLRGQ